MARALVLGATGHIGAHIVRALLAQGHQVRAAYRSERFLLVLEGLPVERVRVDVETLEGVREALAGCEWVFHAAGYYPRLRGSRERAVERGVESTRRVIERLREARPSRIVFTSSLATIRRVPGRAATEDDAEPWPLDGTRSLYATVKIAMEHEMRVAVQAGLPVVIVNPSYCMGEYDARPFSGLLILLFAKHRLPWYLDHAFNVVYTGDVGIGHVRAAERGRLSERYLLSNRNVSLREFARLVTQAAGLSAPRWRLPYPVAVSAALASEAFAWAARTEPLLTRQALQTVRTPQIVDGTKAVRALGMPQTPIDEAIRRALAWFRQHGYLT